MQQKKNPMRNRSSLLHSGCTAVWVALAVFLSHHSVSAFPTGAGSCPSGQAAVGDPHSNAATVTTGTLEESPQSLRVLVNNAVLGDKPSAILAGRAFDLELVAESGTFKGFLIRLGLGGNSNSGTVVDLSSSLLPQDEEDEQVQTAQEVCDPERAGGVTHTSRDDKESIQALIQVPVAGPVILDVTVVIALEDGVSEYYYSSYTVNAVPGAPIPTPSPTQPSSKTCLMVYQNTDNPHYAVHAKDKYAALTSSPLVAHDEQNIRTWIYLDAYNNDNDDNDNDMAFVLPNTMNVNGTGMVTEPFASGGSRYITYDANIETMRIDVELDDEQNSDLGSTIRAFLLHALEDCLTSGYTHLMVLLTGTGGGFAGWGGDVHITGRERELQQPPGSNLQSNANVAGTIRSALDSISRQLFLNTRLQLQVLGLEANSMQGLGVADDYAGVTEYILAGESILPAYGWSYDNLQQHDNALDVARDLLRAYLKPSSTKQQSKDTGVTTATTILPKTIALVNTQLYNTFVAAWESLFERLLAAILGSDPYLRAHISRARASSVAFTSVVDAVIGSVRDSSVDIGSFLSTFSSMCNPRPTSTMATTLQTVRDAYRDMIVEQAVGPCTAPGTGMHVVWPIQGEYNDNRELWRQVLFQEGNYATSNAPAFINFMENFFVPSRGASGTDSVCGNSVASTVGGGSSLVDVVSVNNDTETVELEVTMSADVSEMVAESGVDLSSETILVMREAGMETTVSDYLIALGGNVPGVYANSSFSATWDQTFYYVQAGDDDSLPLTPIYVSHEGGEERKAPVLYFAEDSINAVASFQWSDYLFFDLDVWREQGGQFGFLLFSEDDDGAIQNNVVLYTSDEAGTWAETPKEAGGLLLPLIYVNGNLQGRRIDTIPGGLGQSVLEWSPDFDYTIIKQSAEEVFNSNPNIDGIVLNLRASNYNDPIDPSESQSFGVMSRVVEIPEIIVVTESPTVGETLSVEALELEATALPSTIEDEESTATSIPMAETQHPSEVALPHQQSTSLPMEEATVLPSEEVLPEDELTSTESLPQQELTSLPIEATMLPSEEALLEDEATSVPIAATLDPSTLLLPEEESTSVPITSTPVPSTSPVGAESPVGPPIKDAPSSTIVERGGKLDEKQEAEDENAS